ncbi:MAG: hypothetical protein COA38_13190 [Fluviicola sp.]|nr:MAG: hypothetical protein COA38_13190 [Fluviicola sp.]
MKYSLIIILLSYAFTGIGQVRLNEMQSSNSNTITDNFGENDDWVEIHNPTIDSVEIGGLILKDQLDTWAIPTGDPSTYLPPGGYLLLWADDQESQGIFHTNFKLASGGEFLGLYESDGVTVIDSITIPGMNPDLSYIRCESGWAQTNLPSPLAENNCIVNIGEINTSNESFSITLNDNGALTIDIKDYSLSEYSILLYSMDGMKVIDCPLKEKKTILSPQSLDSGIYVAIMSTDNSTYLKRVWIGK